MNTCQTSIKPIYYYSVAVAHILGLQDQHEITALVPSELIKSGKSNGQTLISQTRIVDPMETIMHPIGQNILSIYPHF